jgi:hypothetical protein
MADKTITTPEAEVIAPEVTTEKPVGVIPEVTVAEITKEVEKPNLIPESVFLGEKKARKAAERELKALKESIESGATKKEISEDIDELGDKFGVDKDFLETYAERIEKRIDQKYADKLKGEKKAESFDVAFDKAYGVAIERGPEFAKVANTEVIKVLARQPQNANKTISQILEETYGKALTGKRSIETTKPGGGKDAEPLDIKRAEKDIEYFKEVMADPKRKAQYNEHMLSKGY